MDVWRFRRFSLLCNYRYMRRAGQAKTKRKFCSYSNLRGTTRPPPPAVAPFCQPRQEDRAGMRAKERSRRVGERIDDAVDDLLDQPLVLALAHDADHRLGAPRRRAQPTMTIEAPLP